MDLTLARPEWSWALPVVIAGALVLLLWWTRRPRARHDDESLWVARTDRLRALPRFKALSRSRRRRGLWRAAAALVLVVGCGLVLLRPQVAAVEAREGRSRDLMLCLDASASMDRYDAAVVDEARGILDHLHGDRVGMMIWSGAAVLVFPLTDDYDYVREQLDKAADAFSGNPKGFYAGVDLAGRRGSLIGDGIVSCVNRFDRPSQERTRAIILASDNDPLGEPSYSLAQAADYAARRHVLIYGVGAPSLSQPGRAAALRQLTVATEDTGGTLAMLGDQAGGQRIVDRIDDLEKARAAQPPRRTRHDQSDVGLLVGGVGLAGLLVLWVVLLLGALLSGRLSGRRSSA